MENSEKTWTFQYYGWFGDGDSSDDLDYEADVSDEEYKVLKKLNDYYGFDEDDDFDDTDKSDLYENFDAEAYIEENQELLDKLQERVRKEIEEIDAENYSSDDEDEMPEICVRLPWD